MRNVFEKLSLFLLVLSFTSAFEKYPLPRKADRNLKDFQETNNTDDENSKASATEDVWDIYSILNSINDTTVAGKDRTTIPKVPIQNTLPALPLEDKLGALLPELNEILDSKPTLSNFFGFDTTDPLASILHMIGFSSVQAALIQVVMIVLAIAGGIFWAGMFVLMYGAIFEGNDTFRRNMRQMPQESLLDVENGLVSLVLKGIAAVRGT